MDALIRADRAAWASRSSSALLSGPPLHTRLSSSKPSFSISRGFMPLSSRFRYSVIVSNSPRSSHIPRHCGHQSTITEDLPKSTDTSFAVLHVGHARSVALALDFPISSISSFSQRKEPCSTLFFNFLSSSLTSQIPLHLGQPSNSIR